MALFEGESIGATFFLAIFLFGVNVGDYHNANNYYIGSLLAIIKDF